MQAMICITPEKGKQAPQGRHTQGHFPQIAFCKRDIKCLLVRRHTHSHIDTQLYAIQECFFARKILCVLCSAGMVATSANVYFRSSDCAASCCIMPMKSHFF